MESIVAGFALYGEYIVRHIHAVIVFYKCVADAHAVSFGDVLGGDICVSYNGKDFIGVQMIESVFAASDSRLGGISLVPMGFLKDVADFEDFSIAARLHGKPALPDQRAAFLVDGRPNAEAALRIPLELFFDPFPNFVVAKCVFIGVHDRCVLQVLTQQREVVLRHFAKDEPFGFNDRFHFASPSFISASCICATRCMLLPNYILGVSLSSGYFYLVQ